MHLIVGSYADTFGRPATERVFKPISKQAEGAKPTNINYILQGGFWTKGYSPGALNGQFFIGITETNVVTAQVMKALLNTYGYTLAAAGNRSMQFMQQFLNKNYGGTYFTYVPTNGVYDRYTNKALIYALQAEMGMSPSVVNGIFLTWCDKCLPSFIPRG